MRKLKLYTNIEKMSPDAAANEEVEQRLSIMNTGKVVLTSSLYGEGYGKYRKGRKEEVMIDPAVVEEIFQEVENFFASQPVYNIIPGFGMWEMSMVGEHNRAKQYFGATRGVYNDLTQFIARRIPIANLMVFK